MAFFVPLVIRSAGATNARSVLTPMIKSDISLLECENATSLLTRAVGIATIVDIWFSSRGKTRMAPRALHQVAALSSVSALEDLMIAIRPELQLQGGFLNVAAGPRGNNAWTGTFSRQVEPKLSQRLST